MEGAANHEEDTPTTGAALITEFVVDAAVGEIILVIHRKAASIPNCAVACG
jgi:hypothetical protein